MAGVNFKRHLIHQCTVERPTYSQDSGGALIPTWSEVDTIDCRYIEKRERIADENKGFMMLEEHRLLCNYGEDIQEADRIKDITLKADDSTVDAGPFTVEEMLARNSSGPHHLSFKLERVE